MKYRVIWRRPAENRLIDIWVNADDQPAVTAAANAIDRDLEERAESVGESRSGNTRVLIHHPLVVYDVNEADRSVDVLSVRYIPPKDN